MLLSGNSGDRGPRGQALVEFAIVLPLLVLILLGVMQFGLLFWGQITLTQVARDTGRWAATQQECDSAGNRAAVLGQARAIALESSLFGFGGGADPDLTITPSWAPNADPCPPADNTTVEWVTILMTYRVGVFLPLGRGHMHADLPADVDHRGPVPHGAGAVAVTPSDDRRGQILVIMALAFVILLGFAALVVDIGMAYAIQREERNETDAAALAGAQELQQPGSRMVTAADRTEARQIAMTNLMNQLAPGDPLPACGFGADFTDCPIPGTDFVVSMRTPTTNCVTCDDERSLLVSLTRQDVGTFFAGLFGQSAWDIRQTSVAGIVYQARYAVITLRPPKSGHPNQNDPNIDVNGSGTSLTVVNGDVGTNTNLVSSGSVILDSGFRVDHYDDPQTWTSPPEGHHIRNLIQDPNYLIPSEAGAAGPFNTLAAADYTDAQCLDIIEGNGSWPGVPPNYVVAGRRSSTWIRQTADDVTCYRPGRYNVELEGGNDEFLLLTPGVYFLNEGADLDSNVSHRRLDPRSAGCGDRPQRVQSRRGSWLLLPR